MPNAQRAPMTQAFASGLHVDLTSKQAGYVDGLTGAQWWPVSGIDPYSYARGFQEGENVRKRTPPDL